MFWLRNKKGDVSIEVVVTAIVFFLGFYIFLVMYDPIVNELLAPILDNTDKIAYGPQAKLIILIVPIVVAILGLVMIVRRMQQPPPQAYYG
jgi:hypothetical protein